MAQCWSKEHYLDEHFYLKTLVSKIHTFPLNVLRRFLDLWALFTRIISWNHLQHSRVFLLLLPHFKFIWNNIFLRSFWLNQLISMWINKNIACFKWNCCVWISSFCRFVRMCLVRDVFSIELLPFFDQAWRIVV